MEFFGYSLPVMHRSRTHYLRPRGVECFVPKREREREIEKKRAYALKGHRENDCDCNSVKWKSCSLNHSDCEKLCEIHVDEAKEKLLSAAEKPGERGWLIENFQK